MSFLVEKNFLNYTVKFSVNYKTSLGQNIYIYGNIDEIGNWKKNVFKLKWTEGHLWKGSLVLNNNVKNFEYKFVCATDDQSYARWEQGENRLFVFDKNLLNKKNKIEVKCSWEMFILEFNIFYPSVKENEYFQLEFCNSEAECVLLSKGVPYIMKLSEKETQIGRINFFL